MGYIRYIKNIEGTNIILPTVVGLDEHLLRTRKIPLTHSIVFW